jgi:hypothetical protein
VSFPRGQTLDRNVNPKLTIWLLTRTASCSNRKHDAVDCFPLAGRQVYCWPTKLGFLSTSCFSSALAITNDILGNLRVVQSWCTSKTCGTSDRRALRQPAQLPGKMRGISAASQCRCYGRWLLLARMKIGKSAQRLLKKSRNITVESHPGGSGCWIPRGLGFRLGLSHR